MTTTDALIVEHGMNERWSGTNCSKNVFPIRCGLRNLCPQSNCEALMRLFCAASLNADI